MATNYPTALQGIPDVIDAVTPADFNRLKDTVVALQALVGGTFSGLLTNTNLSSSAAIAFSKLAALASTNLLVGNGSNVAASVAVTGDVTIGNTGVTAIGTNKVTAPMLATSSILAAAPVLDTSGFTTASTTVVQVTNMTQTFTVPAGGRSVLLVGFYGNMSNNTNSDGAQAEIWLGTVGSGTRLSTSSMTEDAGHVGNVPMIILAFISAPSAGSKTYNLGLKAVTGGTAALSAGATGPGLFLSLLI